jgi:uncharacterized protein YbjT (DUF2867 family)
MSIVITGATGQLGRLVVEQLVAADTPPDTIIATGRDGSLDAVSVFKNFKALNCMDSGGAKGV